MSELSHEVAQLTVTDSTPAAAGDAGGKSKADKKSRAQQSAPARAAGPAIENGGINDADTYGDLVLVQSAFKDTRNWVEIKDLTAERKDEKVWIRARVHAARGKGRFTFMVLRRGFYSVQAIAAEGANGLPKEACKFAAKIPNESVVDIYGVISVPENPIVSTSQSNVEISVIKVFVVSASNSVLPFQIEDASRPEPTEEELKKQAEKQKEAEADKSKKGKQENVDIRVGQDIRLDNRWIDLRTPANHAIFRLQSRVCEYYRNFFLQRDFVEIHTPKLTPGVSEGGAAVFRLQYLHDVPACLAQSPQLYKQAAVSSDLFKVFEIGPVFRAEDSNTHRHMCEFVGMDFEMEIKQHYHEVLKVLSDVFVYIFDNITANCQKELAAVAAQYPFEPLKYRKETLILSFPDAIKLLRESGEPIGDYDDFSTPQEKKLGQLVRAKYDVDFYIVDKYPMTARPFYTMPCPHDPKYTNSYDVFVRGEEITSGAQRIHEAELLKKRAAECGIPASNIEWYLESFKYGAWPHGGAGIGLERVVMLYLGLDNIRKSSMFPRTPYRLSP